MDGWYARFDKSLCAADLAAGEGGWAAAEVGAGGAALCDGVVGLLWQLRSVATRRPASHGSRDAEITGPNQRARALSVWVPVSRSHAEVNVPVAGLDDVEETSFTPWGRYV